MEFTLAAGSSFHMGDRAVTLTHDTVVNAPFRNDAELADYLFISGMTLAAEVVDDETKVLDLGDGSSLPMADTPVDPEPEAVEEVVAPKTKGKK